MFGFTLAISLAIVLVAMLAAMWSATALDGFLLSRKELTYRNRWLRDWRVYKRRNPNVSMNAYIREHEQTDPVIMPYASTRSYEKLMLVLASCLFALEVVLIGVGFSKYGQDSHPGQYTALFWWCIFDVVVILIWWWLIAEEKIVPAYARTPPNYRSSLPPLPRE